MAGKNVKGENGFINIDGKYGSPARMTTIDDPEFWNYVEDGIKPLVEVLLKHGIETYGSCQGHYVPGKPVLNANVRYYVDNRAIGRILQYSVELFANKHVVWDMAPQIEKDGRTRRSDRILFLVSPENREELDAVIASYAKFLDTH